MTHLLKPLVFLLKKVNNFFVWFYKAVEMSRRREVERFLAQSQNLAELETRMRYMNTHDELHRYPNK